MERRRDNPKYPKCGEQIKGDYIKRAKFFTGDTCYGLDWEGHICLNNENDTPLDD